MKIFLKREFKEGKEKKRPTKGKPPKGRSKFDIGELNEYRMNK
jgi:hypothetical protein